MPVKPLILAFVTVVLSLAPAAASSPAPSHGAKPAGDHGEAPPEAKEAEAGNNVVLPTLIAPVVQGSVLTGYLYLSVKIVLESDGDADHLRDVLPLVQDRLLRALNDSPVAAAGADAPATKTAVLGTVKGALAGLEGIDGVQDVSLADYQSVPF